jgi:hypothetical protein
MKQVEDLTITELFDKLSLAIYYGPALRCHLTNNDRAMAAARTLLAEIRQDDFLREKTEK